jgi:uncharacterized protein YggU (UPF0235/DUF167 family)
VVSTFLTYLDISEEYVGISVKARPVDGEANKAIIEYLADIFGLSKSNVELVKGGTNKYKIIALADSELDETNAYEILKNNMI